MLKAATLSAAAMVGTAVFRIVVSSDSMKNATATSHGKQAFAGDTRFHEVTVTEERLARHRLKLRSQLGVAGFCNEKHRRSNYWQEGISSRFRPGSILSSNVMY